MRVLNEDVFRRVQTETNAEELLNRTREQATAKLNAIHGNLSDAQATVKGKGLGKENEERLLDYKVPPGTDRHGSDPYQEFDRCALAAQRGLDGVRQWKGLGGPVQALIIIVILFVITPVLQTIVTALFVGVDSPLSTPYSVFLIAFYPMAVIASIVVIRIFKNSKLANLGDSMSSLTQAVAEAEFWHKQLLSQAQTRYHQTMDEIAQTFFQQVSRSLQPIVTEYTASVNQNCPSWHDPAWQTWTPGAPMPGFIRLGAFMYPQESSIRGGGE
jgi:hypothetical protein